MIHSLDLASTSIKTITTFTYPVGPTTLVTWPSFSAEKPATWHHHGHRTPRLCRRRRCVHPGGPWRATWPLHAAPRHAATHKPGWRGGRPTSAAKHQRLRDGRRRGPGQGEPLIPGNPRPGLYVWGNNLMRTPARLPPETRTLGSGAR
ncbi:hypothetical protein ACCO45_000193 [Purpureocillium lilacinum]|uniref:Uncharacterized protein n=1 Tax=Purpureocillium lilacinum TaxID=33203 RepID=A0ACC4E4Y0_PURLI